MKTFVLLLQFDANMKFVTDAVVVEGMKTGDFGDPLTFHVVPPVCGSTSILLQDNLVPNLTKTFMVSRRWITFILVTDCPSATMRLTFVFLLWCGTSGQSSEQFVTGGNFMAENQHR